MNPPCQKAMHTISRKRRQTVMGDWASYLRMRRFAAHRSQIGPSGDDSRVCLRWEPTGGQRPNARKTERGVLGVGCNPPAGAALLWESGPRTGHECREGTRTTAPIPRASRTGSRGIAPGVSSGIVLSSGEVLGKSRRSSAPTSRANPLTFGESTISSAARAVGVADGNGLFAFMVDRNLIREFNVNEADLEN